MGGRGASSSSSKNTGFAIIDSSGSIYQYRHPTSAEWEEGYKSGGMFVREYRTKKWYYDDYATKDYFKKRGETVYSINAKKVNPKNYIGLNQRRSNEDLKGRLQQKRAGTLYKSPSDRDHIKGYKNGHRIIDKSYRKEAMKEALYVKREDLRYARGGMAPIFGKPSKADVRRVKKLERGIRSLESQLKGLN